MDKITPYFDTQAYERTYGHAPRGRGWWLFYFDEDNNAPADHTWCPGPNLVYGEAKRLAKRRAAEIGAQFVTVAT